MIETKTEKEAEFILKDRIAYELNNTKELISILESNLEHEDEKIQKKTALISIAFIQAVSVMDIEGIKERYKKFNKEKKYGY